MEAITAADTSLAPQQQEFRMENPGGDFPGSG